MQKKRFNEGQILAAIKKQEAGITAKEVCRELGISEATLYNWKAKYGGMQASDISKLRVLEKENSELKKMFAEMSIENRALKNLIEKKL
jgi:putative transposase